MAHAILVVVVGHGEVPILDMVFCTFLEKIRTNLGHANKLLQEVPHAFCLKQSPVSVTHHSFISEASNFISLCHP